MRARLETSGTFGRRVYLAGQDVTPTPAFEVVPGTEQDIDVTLHIYDSGRTDVLFDQTLTWQVPTRGHYRIVVMDEGVPLFVIPVQQTCEGGTLLTLQGWGR